MRLCEQVDERYVLGTTQKGECVCLFLVPRLTLVERPSSLLWSVVFRAVAWVALFCARCALFSFLCGDFLVRLV